MHVGIDLAPHASLMDPAALRVAARSAEQLGYASIWVVDGLVPDGGDEGGPSLAALAALAVPADATERVALGAGLVLGPHDDPSTVLAALRAVDGSSRGRAVLALGADRGVALGDHLDALAGLATPRVLLAVDGPEAAVLLAGRPGLGWSPRGLDPGVLADGIGRLRAVTDDPTCIARVTVHVTDADQPPGRPHWCGSIDQVADDLGAAHRAGATEVVIGLDGRPGLDEALGRWAALAEALDARHAFSAAFG